MDEGALLERLSNDLKYDGEGDTHEDFFGLKVHMTQPARWWGPPHLEIHTVNDRWSCRVEPREAIMHMPPVRLTRSPHPRTGNLFTTMETVEGGVCPQIVPLIEWKSIEVIASDGSMTYDSLEAARKGIHERAEASGAWSAED